MGTVKHVVRIWMENHTSSQVIASRAAPYVTSLARHYLMATHYGDVGSPSLPNYIGATSGDTWGISDDGAPSAHRLTVDNVFRQVRTAGGTERSYQEAMPASCSLASAGRYAVKHNPAAYYDGADDRGACRRDDVQLPSSLPSPLPTFTFVTPDLCHDTHDCSVATGDAWLHSFLPTLLTTPEYRERST
ncbi:MAG: hypothetical protein JO054_07700, partial [Actinobacteria bacterium]|nr:hypothetical protein [Actinomycetota bacterium]